MNGRQRPRRILISFLLLIGFLLHKANAINWDSDIIPTADELEAAKKDALSIYFGKDTENGKLFRTYEYMLKLVGKHVDVPFEQ